MEGIDITGESVGIARRVGDAGEEIIEEQEDRVEGIEEEEGIEGMEEEEVGIIEDSILKRAVQRYR